MTARMWLQLETTIVHKSGLVNSWSPFLFTFWDRLQRVIDDRKPFSWAQSIGWNKGTMSKVVNGHVPGPELLVPISWAENARLDWLLTGRGRPFHGEPYADDQEAASNLQSHLDDSSAWEIHLLTYDFKIAVVLTMPAQIDVKNVTVSYTAMELFVGNVGRYVMAALEFNARDGRGYRAVKVDADTWHQLQRCELGAYQMLKKKGGVLGTDFGDASVIAQHLQHQVAEPTASYNDNVFVLSPEEHDLIQRYEKLEEHDKEVVDHLLERLSPT